MMSNILNILNPETLSYIGNFLDPATAVSLSQANRSLRALSLPMLSDQYKRVFGEINSDYRPESPALLARLIQCAEKQPTASINHNVYKVPSSRLERWKWMVGVENRLEKEVRITYTDNVRLLENTQATSIIQLKHQLVAFWHVEHQYNDYHRFRSATIAQARCGIINKIFFACIKFILLFFYGYYEFPSAGKFAGCPLWARSRDLYAKIGSFTHNDTEYDVVADSYMRDENGFKVRETFYSAYLGSTNITIKKKDESFSYFEPYNPFWVKITRKLKESERDGWQFFKGEEDGHNGAAPVLNTRRHLNVAPLDFRDSTLDSNGSDRGLDKKLTQIMIEMLMQNKHILQLDVEALKDALPVFLAGGFKSDSNSFGVTFRPENIEKQNVKFSKGSPESWANIIRKNPILRLGAGVLPEYWAKKPNIVDG